MASENTVVVRKRIWIAAGLVTASLFTLFIGHLWLKETDTMWSMVDGKSAPGMLKIELIKTLRFGQYTTAVAWSSDGRYLATSDYYDKVVRIWDVKSWRQLHVITKKTMGAGRMLFMPDSKTLIVSSTQLGDDRSAVTLVDVPSGEIIRQVDGPNEISGPDGWAMANQPRNFDLSHDGKYLFVNHRAKQARKAGVYVYDAKKWNIVSFIRPKWGVMALAAGPLDDQLVTSDVYGGLQIWSVSQAQMVEEFPITSSWIKSIAVEEGGNRVIAGQAGVGRRRDQVSGKIVPYGDMDTLRLWNLKTKEKIASATLSPQIGTVRLWREGGIVVASGGDRRLVVYSLSDLREIAVLRKFSQECADIAFLHDGGLLAVAGDDEVLIYSIKFGGNPNGD
ncbi:hypothetical protein [Parvibaculum sp.]|uniref:WD40 repeat domain-containing protein n=1 Tax=Parvibaculum sp. TaxID=2024848 RepID=UPI0032105CD2